MIAVQDFGLLEYTAAWALQKETLQQVALGEAPPTLLVGEHPPVYTTGRKNRPENWLLPDIPVIEIERGGDVTYHGPGQLIIYPILPLPPHYRDLHLYLRDLEECLINALAHFGQTGFRNPGWTGVWVHDHETNQPVKMASIGVAVSKWVTYHGISLNITNNMAPFQAINPCGLSSEVMTRLIDQLPPDFQATFQDVKSISTQLFVQYFDAILMKLH